MQPPPESEQGDPAMDQQQNRKTMRSVPAGNNQPTFLFPCPQPIIRAPGCGMVVAERNETGSFPGRFDMGMRDVGA